MADEAIPAPKYEVTATRRRPKTFDELAGQEFVVSTLKNSLESGQIAHAYLFSGPRGCGKTSAARILARSLNCEKGPTAAPCGVCSNCREISQGSSMDVIEIDGASNNSVNDVRQIKDEVLFPPQSGKYKVYIIDEVHMLSSSAFNALLKTIEEPPPYIVFIFATTEMQKVPATIKSRCQQFAFRLIPIETIQGILKNICEELKIEAEDEALFWIARESTGSLRDAFTLFDQVASFSAGHISAQLIREKLGLAGLEKLNSLAEACATNDTPQCFALIDEILGSGVAIEQFIIDLAGFYRSLLLLKNGVTRESLLGYKPERFSARALESLDSIRLEQALELLLDCYRDIRYSVSPRFELETTVSKLSWLSRWVSPPELRAAVDAARNALGQNAIGDKARGQDGLDRPLAGGPPRGPRESFGNTPRNQGPRFSGETAAGDTPPFGAAQSAAFQSGDTANRSTADANARFNGPPSLTEEFKRRMAARESEAAVAANTAGGSGGFAVVGSSGGAAGKPEASPDNDAEEADEEEDVPIWSTLSKTFEKEIAAVKDAKIAEQGGGAAEQPVAGPPLDPRTERVLRIFRGTIVK